MNNKMERIDFHALRHTFATWLAMQGVSLYDIMQLMGHQSLAMTERYAQHDPSKTKQVVQKMYSNFSLLIGKNNNEEEA
jgi:integrase